MCSSGMYILPFLFGLDGYLLQTQICHKVTRTASNQQLFCPYISINFQRTEKCFK